MCAPLGPEDPKNSSVRKARIRQNATITKPGAAGASRMPHPTTQGSEGNHGPPYRVSACPCAMNWLKKSVLQDDLFCSTPFFRLNSLRAHESRFLISASRISHAAFRCFGVTCSSFWAISSKTCSFLERTLWRSTEPAEISGAFRSRIKTFMLGAWMPRSTGCLERRLWSGCFAAQSGGFSGCMG